MEKAEIRKEIKSQRAALDPGWINDMSLVAQDMLSGLSEFKQADTVACYLALKKEVSTSKLIEECWAASKELCVPAYQAEEDVYGLSQMTHEAKLAEGPMSVLEPAEKSWVSIDDVDLIIVPGLAFDLDCNRVGYGGGYYDRMMSGGINADKAYSASKVGLAFDFQIIDGIPAVDSDVRLDMIVTEKRIIRGA